MSGSTVIVTAPMHTTITVNGADGSRFLAALGEHTSRMPAILAVLARRRANGEPIDSVEVLTDLAEEVAEFVGRMIADGVATPNEPPLLFSPAVGDTVAIVRDVLVEFQVAAASAARRAPRIWRYVPRGTRGRLIAHQGETSRVLLEPAREIAYIGARSMTGVRFLRQ